MPTFTMTKLANTLDTTIMTKTKVTMTMKVMKRMTSMPKQMVTRAMTMPKGRATCISGSIQKMPS